MNQRTEIECPFCGKEDIKFGLALCAQCQAEIHYHVRDGVLSTEDMREYEAHHARMVKKLKPPTSFLGLMFSRATLAKVEAMEKEAQAFELAAKTRYAAELKRLEAKGYRETVVFQRGERVVERQVDVPPNGEEVPALHRVELAHLGPKKVVVTQLISKTFKVGVREAIELSESLPLLLLETASKKDAEEMKDRFEKAGGACNMKAG